MRNVLLSFHLTDNWKMFAHQLSASIVIPTPLRHLKNWNMQNLIVGCVSACSLNAFGYSGCTIPRRDARTQSYSDQSCPMHSNGFSELMHVVHVVRKLAGWCNDWRSNEHPGETCAWSAHWIPAALPPGRREVAISCATAVHQDAARDTGQGKARHSQFTQPKLRVSWRVWLGKTGCNHNQDAAGDAGQGKARHSQVAQLKLQVSWRIWLGKTGCNQDAGRDAGQSRARQGKLWQEKCNPFGLCASSLLPTNHNSIHNSTIPTGYILHDIAQDAL